MRYRAALEGLEFRAVIGILPHERRTPQKIVVDAAFEYETKEAYIDYAKAAALIQKHIKEQKFYLLEEALDSCAELLKKNFPQMSSLYLCIKKPQILPNATPSVSIFLNFA